MVCEGDRTCCPPGLEAALRHSSAHDFHRAVRQSSHHLRHSLSESAVAIQGTSSSFPFICFLLSRSAERAEVARNVCAGMPAD